MKKRIDIILLDRGLVESRTKSQWLIKQGWVLVNGKRILKPGKKLESSVEIQLKDKFPYVGVGGLKLEAALREFSIQVENKICVDVGTSIGGFTDCLIKHGASKVYAIDTAWDLLHPSLRIWELEKILFPIPGKDARTLIRIEEQVNICTIDVTFASLKEILPNVKPLLKKSGDIIALVKPIFETEFKKKKNFNIIHKPQQLHQILKGLIDWNLEHQIYPNGIIKSPLLGKGGSTEFFIHLKIDKMSKIFDIEQRLNQVLFIKEK